MFMNRIRNNNSTFTCTTAKVLIIITALLFVVGTTSTQLGTSRSDCSISRRTISTTMAMAMVMTISQKVVMRGHSFAPTIGRSFRRTPLLLLPPPTTTTTAALHVYSYSNLQFHHQSRIKQYQYHYSNTKQKNGICLRRLPSQGHHLSFSSSSSSSTSLTKNEIQIILSGKNVNEKANNSTKNQSIYNTLQAAIELMEEYNSPEPTISACHLLSFALKDDFKWEDNGFSVLYSLLQNEQSDNSRNSINIQTPSLKDKILTNEELDTFSSMVQRRMTNEPIQYIIGQWDFHDITIKVRPPCLCPRPETEELVEYVAKDIRNLLFIRRNYLSGTSGSSGSSGKNIECESKSSGRKKVRVLDVGCGTGAISIALAKMFSPDDVEFVSIDVSKEAIELTKENARRILGDDIYGGDEKDRYYNAFLCSAAEFTNNIKETNKNKVDSTKSDDHDDNDRGGCTDQFEFGFDIVVSNPPYIPEKDMETLSEDVVGYEDYGALCGGDDGMDVIRDIVQNLPEWCRRVNPNGCDDGDVSYSYVGDAICWMEVDTSHPKLMRDWLTPNDNNDGVTEKHNGGVEFVEGLSDFFGLDRFVKLKIKT